MAEALSDPGLARAHLPVDVAVWAQARAGVLARMKRALRLEAERRGLTLTSEPTALLVDPYDDGHTAPTSVTGDELEALTAHGCVLVRMQAMATPWQPQTRSRDLR